MHTVRQQLDPDSIVIGQTAATRLIFLDIDGVLLSFGGWITPHNEPLWRLPVERRMEHLQLNHVSVSLVVRLCDRAGAKLVLSSTWRKTWPHDLSALHDRLIEQGLRRDLWHEKWMLPVIPGNTKWQELAQWDGWSPDAGALIIDDEFPPEDAPSIPAEHVVILQVDQYDGFGACNYFDGLEIFGVEDGGVKPPKGLPPERGGRRHPAFRSASPRPGPSFKP